MQDTSVRGVPSVQAYLQALHLERFRTVEQVRQRLPIIVQRETVQYMLDELVKLKAVQRSPDGKYRRNH